MLAPTTFGERLKNLRHLRAYSQLELAERCGVSQRHVAFLERGRSKPSRRMVLDLAETLQLPLDARNHLLLSAGFAAVYPDTPPDAAGLEFADQAIDLILSQQAPYPALVVDRLWQLRKVNAGCVRMMCWLTGMPEDQAAHLLVGQNLLQLMMAEPIRSQIPTGVAIARRLLAVSRRQLDLSLEGLEKLDALEASLKLPRATGDEQDIQWPAVPIVLRKGNEELRLISTITTLGTPTDVRLQDTMIESFFPADDVTRAWFKGQ